MIMSQEKNWSSFTLTGTGRITGLTVEVWQSFSGVDSDLNVQAQICLQVVCHEVKWFRF